MDLHLDTRFHEEEIKVRTVARYLCQHRSLLHVKLKFPEIWEAHLDFFTILDEIPYRVQSANQN